MLVAWVAGFKASPELNKLVEPGRSDSRFARSVTIRGLARASSYAGGQRHSHGIGTVFTMAGDECQATV